MTIFVNESSKSVLSGISKMKSAMIEDYNRWMPPTSETRTKMNEEFASGFEVKYGSKYIKLLTKNGGCVTAFIVGVDTDKKFKKGDILMPAGWAGPARNAARGNVLEGNYPINWTGPVYLK
jgi:hypothetical protein